MLTDCEPNGANIKITGKENVSDQYRVVTASESA